MGKVRAVGQNVGYVRVSSLTQNTERQLEGIDLDRVFTDKVSGVNAERPQLADMCDYVRDGDTVYVHSMDRLARRLVLLKQIVDDLTAKGATVKFVKEGLTFTGDDTPMQNLLLSMMGAVAEFERAYILERQREGVALAKRDGKYKGRSPTLSPVQAVELRQRAAAGEKKTLLAKEYGIGKTTLYNYLKKDTK